MNISEQLMKFVSDELLSGRIECKEDDDLLADGMVDSVGIMRLVMFVETDLGVKIPPEDLTVENLRTVNVLSEFLQNRINAGESSSQ